MGFKKKKWVLPLSLKTSLKLVPFGTKQKGNQRNEPEKCPRPSSPAHTLPRPELQPQLYCWAGQWLPVNWDQRLCDRKEGLQRSIRKSGGLCAKFWIWWRVDRSRVSQLYLIYTLNTCSLLYSINISTELFSLTHTQFYKEKHFQHHPFSSMEQNLIPKVANVIGWQGRNSHTKDGRAGWQRKTGTLITCL